jgi:hypothetical protein
VFKKGWIEADFRLDGLVSRLNDPNSGCAMALNKQGGWWYASNTADLDQYLRRQVLAKHCRDVPHRVTFARCAHCEAGQFDLFIDQGERILRVCTKCQAEHPVCDLDGKFDITSSGEIVCRCMFSECEVAVGFALMDPPEGGTEEDGPVGHLYVAGRCTECGQCGVYGEWGPDGDFTFAELAKSV